MNFINRIHLLIAFGGFFQSGFSQVGINTTTPLSTLDINGNLNVKEIGIINSNVAGSAVLLGGPSGSATQINDGVYISITPSGSNNDFELPNPTLVPGRIYIIRNISSTNTAYILTSGTTSSTGKFFAKDSSNSTPSSGIPVISMPANGSLKSIIIVSDGNNWTYFF